MQMVMQAQVSALAQLVAGVEHEVNSPDLDVQAHDSRVDLQQVFFKEDNLFIILINEFEEEEVPAAEISTEPGSKS